MGPGGNRPDRGMPRQPVLSLDMAFDVWPTCLEPFLDHDERIGPPERAGASVLGHPGPFSEGSDPRSGHELNMVSRHPGRQLRASRPGHPVHTTRLGYGSRGWRRQRPTTVDAAIRSTAQAAEAAGSPAEETAHGTAGEAFCAEAQAAADEACGAGAADGPARGEVRDLAGIDGV